jgi:hypothetical protein
MNIRDQVPGTFEFDFIFARPPSILTTEEEKRLACDGRVRCERSGIVADDDEAAADFEKLRGEMGLVVKQRMSAEQAAFGTLLLELAQVTMILVLVKHARNNVGRVLGRKQSGEADDHTSSKAERLEHLRKRRG